MRGLVGGEGAGEGIGEDGGVGGGVRFTGRVVVPNKLSVSEFLRLEWALCTSSVGKGVESEGDAAGEGDEEEGGVEGIVTELDKSDSHGETDPQDSSLSQGDIEPDERLEDDDENPESRGDR